MYEVLYYKRLENKWLKGRVRNLTFAEAIFYSTLLSELFDTKLIKIREMTGVFA